MTELADGLREYAGSPRFLIIPGADLIREGAGEIDRLASINAELYEALLGLLPHTTVGNDPTTDASCHAHEVAHWEYERERGNGHAPAVLAAYAALTKTRGAA